MATSLQLNYDRAREAIALLKGWDINFANWPQNLRDKVDIVIRSGQQRVYNAHPWSFLRPHGSISCPAPYTTGQIIVAAHEDGSQVLLGGGTWPDWAADGILTIEGGGNYIVSSRTDGTNLVLEDRDVVFSSAVDFTLRQYRYDLPEDFGGLDGPITFSPGETYLQAIRVCHESNVRLMLHDRYRTFESTDPMWAAVYVRQHDLTTPQTWKLIVYPPSNRDLLLTYRYRAQPNAIDDANPYPLGGAMHSETFLEAILAEAEVKFNATTREHEARFQERLAASIALDRNQGSGDFMPAMKQPFNDYFYNEMGGEWTYPWMAPGLTIPEGYEGFF